MRGYCQEKGHKLLLANWEGLTDQGRRSNSIAVRSVELPAVINSKIVLQITVTAKYR